MNDQLLTEKRLTGDAMADPFIESIFADPKQRKDLQIWLAGFSNNKQFNLLPANYAELSLFKNADRLPDWADRNLMKAGAAFFAKHAEPVMNLLGLLSLPYCYAAAKGAMVLYLSDRMRSDAAKRLFETADFVWDVLSPDAFTENGKGFASILKVRLMHAAARYYTFKSGKWDEAWGYPVNQEDMAGTNLSFSLIVIRGLRKFGYTITYEEQQAYIHLWNVIGYMLGLEKILLPQNGKEAFNLEQLIRERQFEPSEQGRSLTNSLTGYFYTVNNGSAFSNAEILQLMRYLMGDEAADTVGIGGEKLPVEKVGLLKLKNFFQGFNVPANSRVAYKQGYAQFRAASTVVNN